MDKPITRSIPVTYFDVVCVNPTEQKVVVVSLYLLDIYDSAEAIMKQVKKRGLLNESLIPRRVKNIRSQIEYRGVSKEKFYNNSTLKRRKVL